MWLENIINVVTDVCILSTSNKHDTNREDLLCVCVGWHVAEAHAGQTAEGEVERGDVDAADGRPAAGPVHTSYSVVWRLQTLPELMEPSCFLRWCKMGTLMDRRTNKWLELATNALSLCFYKLIIHSIGLVSMAIKRQTWENKFQTVSAPSTTYRNY